jgi:hypothetical protein
LSTSWCARTGYQPALAEEVIVVGTAFNYGDFDENSTYIEQLEEHRLRGEVGGWRDAGQEYHKNRGPARTDAPTSLSDNRTWGAFDRRATGTPVPDDRIGRDGKLRRLLEQSVSLDTAYWAIQAEAERLRGTAQSTVEAILCAVSQRGLAALQEPAVRERAERCDAAAREQINQRIARLPAKGGI